MEFFEKRKIEKVFEKLLDKWDYRISKERVIKDFQENIDDFIAIATFIKDFDKDQNESIFIEKINNNYTAEISSSKGQKNVNTIDSSIDNSIRNLFNDHNYRYIDEDGGNGIYFTLDDTGIGFGHGIAFSKNTEKLDGWGTEITLQEEIQDDWYYFEAD
jgi:hypothetical protein